MEYLTFSCGCKFPMVDNKIGISFDPEDHDFQCQSTWDLISSGNTKGVFQLESNFGQQYAERLKPRCLEHLAALTAILRPGCCESTLDDGKSITDHYIMRKNGEEVPTYLHPILESSLSETFALLIYQEQALQICKDIAGLNLEQAELLRKAMGKKIPEEMAKVKIIFMEGARALAVVPMEIAEQIFDWIEKSQRYSFNASHSFSYGMVSYLTAYVKNHFPGEFFTSYLRHAHTKSDPKMERFELVNNSKLANLEVCIPDIRLKNKHFIQKDNNIYFGLTDISGIGMSVYNKMMEKLNVEKPMEEWDNNYFLFKVADDIGYTNAITLAEVGAFGFLNPNRIETSFYLSKVKDLNEREREYICANLLGEKKSVREIFEIILAQKPGKNSGISTKPRAQKVRDIYNSIVSPPYSLEDNATFIAKKESDLLGISITCSEVDSCDISIANCTCKEFATTRVQNAVIGCVIEQVKENRIKKGPSEGKMMAFLTISDNSYSLGNVVIFSECYEKYRDILIKNNKVILSGTRDKKKESLVVQKVWQLL